MQSLSFWNSKIIRRVSAGILSLALIASCAPALHVVEPSAVEIEPVVTEMQAITPTPLPTRPVYDPGTLVEYTAQSGDSAASVAAHFNSTAEEVLDANSSLTEDSTTLYPGVTYQIPIYYESLWGNPFQILPDASYVNGPAGINFDTRAFVNASSGWLKDFSTLADGETRRGGDLIEYIALNHSVSPRVLLALAEYQTGALSNPTIPADIDLYPLGYVDIYNKGFFRQLDWAANTLNNGYYGWRRGSLDAITHLDGTIELPDPWQNAATVALQSYYSQILPIEDYYRAIYADGFSSTYTQLFGDPWSSTPNHIPGDLLQPALVLPFQVGTTWTYTGGPHGAWGEGEPLSAIDFGPPSGVDDCGESPNFVLAIASGQIVRSEPAIAVLDLDSDGDERTGWVIFYLHLGVNNKVRQGVLIKTNDPIGHPSCEGGIATGTHIHIARKYNGEWMLADGAVPFNLDGWIAGIGSEPYLGTLDKFGRTVEAGITQKSQIRAGD